MRKKKASSAPPNGWSSRASALDHAVAYFNVDVAVSGPDFSASAVPSLKEFIRDSHALRSQPARRHRLRSVAPQGPLGSRTSTAPMRRPLKAKKPTSAISAPALTSRPSCSMPAFPQPTSAPTVPTAFITPPSTTSPGSRRTPIPHFVYLQQMARVLGLEAMRMADADVLPYDYVAYAREISAYIQAAKHKATNMNVGSLEFGPAETAAAQFPRRRAAGLLCRVGALRQSRTP